MTMTEETTTRNSIAALKNVTALVSMIDRLNRRQHGLPGMGVLHGFSGYGKTSAAIYAANVYQACSVQVKSQWTAKALCLSILLDIGVKPATTTHRMIDQVSEHLAVTRRPLIIDEADFLVERRIIEIVRDIAEGSGATIVLIGMEELPQALMKWEQFHGRVAEWVMAEAADIDDVRELAYIYAPGITVDAELQEHVLHISHRSIRRISVNLARIAQFARPRRLTTVTRETWGNERLFTGEAPTPRRMVR